MKVVIILISSIILGNTLLGQKKTISEEDFNLLVDYANCRYFMDFIETNDVGTSYFNDTYKRKIKPIFDRLTLSNFETLCSYQKLKELLFNNSKALNLADKIDKRKLKYHEFSDDKSLINSLSTTNWLDVDLSNTATSIINEISAKYTLQLYDDNSVYSEDLKLEKHDLLSTESNTNYNISEVDLSKPNRVNKNIDVVNKTSSKGFKITIYILFILLFGLLISSFLYLKQIASRETIINHVLKSQRIKEKFEVQKENKYSLNEEDVNLIIEKVLEKIPSQSNYNQQIPDNYKEDNFNKTNTVVKYLKGKLGNRFSRIESTPENSFFKLVDENGDTALFEFCGDDSEAIAKRVFSEDICKIVAGSYQNAKSITTLKPGKIKNISGHWEVIEPLEIKLI